MEAAAADLTELDEVFLARACELAARAIGNTAPNPPVGAVVVRDGVIVGEGYHHRAGEPHAEVNALGQAGERARDGTLYVSLEPCAHVGRTPPCTAAIIAAGIVRVVAGASDPTGHGDVQQLRRAEIRFVLAGDPHARALVESFGESYALNRPYVGVKMAVSLDGAIASRSGVREQLTGAAMQRRVRRLRIAYDAVMVGAATVRIDDPLLTVRPAHDRLRPYNRVVVCGRKTLPVVSRVFGVEQGYAKTILLVPAACAAAWETLNGKAQIIAVGSPDSEQADLGQGLRALRDRGIYSVLCEGGPTLATSLIAYGFADRFYWAIAPRVFGEESAVPVLARTLAGKNVPALEFRNVEQIGPDVLLEGRFVHV